MTSRKLVVAAIDFGTTFSGWAFSFYEEYRSDPTKVYSKPWHSSSRLVSEKAPTCALIKPDGKTLEAFGFDAENRYRDLAEDGEHGDYYFFQRFKMALHLELKDVKTINTQMMIEDVRGRKLSALTVFSLVIEFLSKDLLAECRKQMKGILESDFRWVLTVPAIWTDAAKQFMRKAAVQGGLATDRLLMALEPEAASIFAKHIPVRKGSDEASIGNFKPGDRYMVLDAGGGTIDITVHEVDRNGGIKEVVAASGGGWGGTLVDDAFENLIRELFGNYLVDKFKQPHTEEWLDLVRDFELKKKTVNLEHPGKLRLKIPLALLEKKPRIQEQLKRHAGVMQLKKDTLILEAPAARDLFSNAVKKTVEHVRQLMSRPELRNLSGILMVGGFSDSPILQKSIEEAFPDIPVIKPKEASLSVLKGAVIFGHNPNTISERVLKYTYGVASTQRFKQGIHPESKKIHTDAGELCTHVFNQHAKVGQTVKVGVPQVHMTYTPVYRDQRSLLISIFASENKNPMYTDEDCVCLGEFEVDMSGDLTGDLDRLVKCRFTFSGTEITVKARFESTREVTYGTFSYPESEK